jgi:hypothetical protein
MAAELQVQRAKKARSAQLQQVQKHLQAQQQRVRGLRATTLRVPSQPVASSRYYWLGQLTWRPSPRL